MEEVVDGIHHWTAEHPNIGMEVSSYYVEPARTLIDPMASDEALEWLGGLDDRPERVVLTNRHHLRGSVRLRDEFGCSIHCHRAGLHEFEGGPDVQGFAFGDELAIADGVVHYGELRFVPDNLLGDNPEVIKEDLRRSYARLLDRPFDALLFAHGEPIADGGKDLLKEFVGQ